MTNLASYTLAGHLYFWPEGDTFTSAFAANPDQSDVLVAEDAWPAADDAAMQDYKIGDIESDATFERTEENISPRRAVLGQVVKKDDITTYQELKLNVTTNSAARIAIELMFGSSARLSESQAQFVPLSARPKKGMLRFDAYNQDDEYQFTGAIWVRAKVTGGVNLDGRDIIKPKFEFIMLQSDLNTMGYGSESQLV